MAYEKLTDRSELLAAADTDLVHVVDVSDTAVDAAGNSKKMTVANLMKSAPVQSADIANFATETYVNTAVGNEESARITADSNLQSQINGNDTDIIALDTRVTTNEGEIVTLDSRITTAEGDIASLQSQVTSNDSDITSLNGRMTTAEGEIDALQAQTYVASLNTLTGSVTLAAGTDINLSTAGSTITINSTASGGGGGGSDSFSTIVVSGQSDVVADSGNDTLTLVAGTNLSITTDATADSITFNVVGLDTDDVAEGTNLYYTDTRVGTYLTTNKIYASYPTTTLTGNTLLTSSHEQKMLVCDSGAGMTLQVPTGLGRDAEILVYQANTGAVTISAGSGVTLRTTSGFDFITAEQYAIIGLKQLGTTEVWVVTGERKPI